jgi:MFS family permease
MSTAANPGVTAGRQTSNARRWTIIGLLSLGMIIAYVDRSNISVALAVPEFKTLFQLSDSDRGLLNSAFFWSYAFLQIPAGWVVDRYGVKAPYALAFLFWSLISAGTAMATSVGQLLTLRVLLGVGESIVTPASMRWIRFNFAEKERGFAVGMYMTGTKIGPAIGAPVAAWLIHAYDWRMMFLVLGLGCLFWLMPWMGLVKNNDRELEKAAAVKASAPPVSFGRIMSSPVIWGTIIGTFCYMYFVYFCMTWMPAYFVERRGLSLTGMGTYQFASFGGMAAMAAIAGWAADRMISQTRLVFGRRSVMNGLRVGAILGGIVEFFRSLWRARVLEAVVTDTLYGVVIGGGIGLALVLAAWSFDRLAPHGLNAVPVRKGFTIAGFVMASTQIFGAMSDSTSVALFFAVFSLSGLGLATANYWALTQTLIPGGAIGRIVGIQNCAANIPGIVAPLLTGWLKEATGGYTLPMMTIGFFLALGIASYVFLVREKYAPAAVPRAA